MNYQHISIFTDGSCDSRKQVGGWAAIILIDQENVVLKGTIPEVSHHRMELIAVIKALDYIRDKGVPKSLITIFTDSQYVAGISHRKERLKADEFLTKKRTPIRNSDLVQILMGYLDEFEGMEFTKIPSHGKVRNEPNYNREVDMLCRKAVRDYNASTLD